MREAGYAPIEAYGVIGNLETCALVAPDGSIDWFPFPHVESPSVFAAILDAERGGRFRIGPADPVAGSQRYVDRTHVLETTFRSANGSATVTDFLPPAEDVVHPSRILYRKVACAAGSVDLEVAFEPRFDYGRAETSLSATGNRVRAEGGGERAVLEGPVPLEVRDGRATGGIALEAGESEWFLLRCAGTEGDDAAPDAALADTIDFWRGWSHECAGTGDCAFDGPWHDHVVRSGLVLKLLTHAASGGIAAAPTTSLPEDVGGVRNWDYRYTWLRDAGFTVQALANLGHEAAANEYLEWFMEHCQSDAPEALQPLYGLHGDADVAERELDNLAGYKGSRPVRVGNAAVHQTQLDIYGELLLAYDEMLDHAREVDPGEWDRIRAVVDHVRDVWREADAGIWEVRGGPRQFVYSKVMCWLALDRGIDIAEAHDLGAPLTGWRDARRTIREDVLENGYDEDLGAFVQAYGTTALDATGLLIPIVGFLPFADDRVQGTIAAIEDRLAEDGLVRRYDGDDGLPGREGAFVLCSCWLVDALALSGRVEEAAERLETLLGYVNSLGLVAEEVDPETGAHLGNYPQAFSHIGIVNSALYVGWARGHDVPGPPPMGIQLGDPVDAVDR